MSEKSRPENHFLEAVANIGRHTIGSYRYALKQVPSLGGLFWTSFGLSLLLLLVWSLRGTHLWFLHRLWPELFSVDLASWLSLTKPINHFSFLATSFTLSTFYVIGIRHYSKVRRYERAFAKAGIRNSLGEYPRILDHKQPSSYRSKVRVLIDGIDVDEFTKKSNALESGMGRKIEYVKREQDPRFVELYLTSKQIPKRVRYSDVHPLLNTPYTFLVGESLGNVLTQDLSKLPHALVAGSTGSGKSVFLKQMLMGLLEGSPSLQVYLIDLKNGLELKDFTLCPNVIMVKKVSDALVLLRQVRREMEKRFELLEKKGFNRIDPERDRRDRIVVCVDEASVLYSTNRANSSDKELAREASEVTDEIAKLSRAAGIHLIFATQKVTKETLNTHIQENLEGRMCFEVNSFQGSNMVLGTGDAKDLPHIPGRGIWKVGARLTEVQTPFIEDTEIQQRCKIISMEFKSGKRRPFQDMFSPRAAIKVSDENIISMTKDGKEPSNG